MLGAPVDRKRTADDSASLRSLVCSVHEFGQFLSGQLSLEGSSSSVRAMNHAICQCAEFDKRRATLSQSAECEKSVAFPRAHELLASATATSQLMS